MLKEVLTLVVAGASGQCVLTVHGVLLLRPFMGAVPFGADICRFCAHWRADGREGKSVSGASRPDLLELCG